MLNVTFTNIYLTTPSFLEYNNASPDKQLPTFRISLLPPPCVQAGHKVWTAQLQKTEAM
jgi:hypothetical protein